MTWHPLLVSSVLMRAIMSDVFFTREMSSFLPEISVSAVKLTIGRRYFPSLWCVLSFMQGLSPYFKGKIFNGKISWSTTAGSAARSEQSSQQSTDNTHQRRGKYLYLSVSFTAETVFRQKGWLFVSWKKQVRHGCSHQHRTNQKGMPCHLVTRGCRRWYR